MKNWEDIQNEIRKTREPLSPQAWSQLEAKLNSGRRAGFPWLLGMLIIGLVLSGWAFFKYSNIDKEYYEPRLVSGPSGDSPVRDAATFPQKLKDNNGQGGVKGAGKNYNIAQKLSRGDNSLEKEGNAPALEAAGEREERPPVKKVNGLKGKPAPESDYQKRDMETLLILPPADTQLPDQVALLRERPMGVIPGVVNVSVANQLPASRLELRFFMAPTYNMPSLEYHNQENQTHKEFEEAVNNAVKPGWGLDAGFEVRYRLFKNFRISTGFTYREIVTQNNYDFEMNEIPVIDSATGNILAYIPASQPERRMESSSNIYTFLNVPLSLYYEKPLAGRWTLTGEVINNLSFLVNQSGYGIDPTTLELEKKGDSFFNKTTSSYQLRLGLRYKLIDNFYLALEPAYRKSYQDFISDAAVSWKPQDFSLSLTGIVILK